MRLIAPERYDVEIAGEQTALPMLQLDDQRAIALLMDIDMGLAFGARVGRALAARFAAAKPDIVVGSATLGIPVAMEVSRHLGLDRYLILQKSPKFHLADALEEPVRSITSDKPQRLMLDRRQILARNMFKHEFDTSCGEKKFNSPPHIKKQQFRSLTVV